MKASCFFAAFIQFDVSKIEVFISKKSRFRDIIYQNNKILDFFIQTSR